ncbi:peptide/nickel transport system permease protein [Pararhizobium capsulatum DSM 1112]|uniref:Peptide/nickel transport system permease protein n=1 Tax=Pararhizobium capsulatum DSM 1112 TaxID=1121113 RepID=A0ABU0BYA2_9HYPH|nr:ABC transporter permease [Pararhizobium capsulatum]MDQ0323246.1 peptide/nickel transport system permease protein [Pararhizobium capsulatum DSM 1112]
MQILRYLSVRLLFAVPQLLGIAAVAFFLLKLIPGDPAPMMLGPLATQEAVTKLRVEMGLDQPLPTQFLAYLGRLAHGDLGTSWQTTNPVLIDIAQRLPATLELVTLSLVLALAIGLPLGLLAGRKSDGISARFADVFSVVAGALPDFWLALVLIFIFYSIFNIVPPPIGRLDFAVFPPTAITGSYVIDAMLSGDFATFKAAAGQLILPVATLGLIYSVPVLTMTRTTVSRLNDSDFVRFADAKGLSPSRVSRHVLRNAMPSVVTVIGILYSTLVGSVVLVEVVFAWGGIGQYAVSAVLNADINASLGFILAAAVVSLLVHLIVDFIALLLDPRLRSQ